MKREAEIITLLNKQNNVHVNDIAMHFGVTPTSIRRDLVKMEANGLIKRTHGYAHLVSHSLVKDYNSRNILFSEEKRRIAKAAVKLIADGQAAVFDSGTTTLALAEELAVTNHPGLTIITATLPIASRLAKCCRVLMPGGLVQAEDMSLIGPEADAYMRSITADLAFLGSSGVRPGLGLTASSPFLVSIKKQILTAAKKSVALLDSSKFHQDGVHLFTEFSEMRIKTIITVKNENNNDALTRLERMGIEIITA